MKNLAGVDTADETILEELYLADIPKVKIEKGNTEVPYTYTGRIGKWLFRRAWCYWVVSVEDGVKGLPLDVALKLHNKKHPARDYNLGEVIRSGGHGGGPSPDEYGAQPIYDDELDKKLIELGYKFEYSKLLKREYIPISVGEVSKLCNEGKLVIDRYVDSYHIDDQVGLNELVKILKENAI